MTAPDDTPPRRILTPEERRALMRGDGPPEPKPVAVTKPSPPPAPPIVQRPDSPPSRPTHDYRPSFPSTPQPLWTPVVRPIPTPPLPTSPTFSATPKPRVDPTMSNNISPPLIPPQPVNTEAQAEVFPTSDNNIVPPPMKRHTRFPILILIDTSGSTGIDEQTQTIDGPGADIHRINSTVRNVLTHLRYPDAGSSIYDKIDNIDLAVMTYNSKYNVEMPWSICANIDPMIGPFVAGGGTATHAAMSYAIRYIGDQVRFYNRNNLKYGRATILHITDGEPQDMMPGDAKWLELQESLGKLTSPDPKKIATDVRHLISANGHDPHRARAELNGRKVTGFELLSMLSGDASVFKIDDHPDIIGELVEFITVLVEHATKIFGSSVEAQAAEDEITNELGDKIKRK